MTAGEEQVAWWRRNGFTAGEAMKALGKTRRPSNPSWDYVAAIVDALATDCVKTIISDAMPPAVIYQDDPAACAPEPFFRW